MMERLNLTHKAQSTAMMRVMSSVGRPTEVSTITMVTSPACGIPAAPMLAAVAVMLGGETEEQSANTLYNTNNGLVEEGTFFFFFSATHNWIQYCAFYFKRLRLLFRLIYAQTASSSFFRTDLYDLVTVILMVHFSPQALYFHWGHARSAQENCSR